MRACSLLLAAAWMVALAAACQTTPSVEDRAKADGNYQVAVSLVHEAEQKGATGNISERDLKYREALRELLDGQKNDPENDEVQYLLGVVYFIGFGRHDDALVALRSAVALRQLKRKEEYPEAENLIGTILVDQGKPQEAIPYFERARTNLLYSTPYYAEQELGWAYFKLGKTDQAVSHLSRALISQPDLCGAYVKLAEVEVARGNDARAQEILQDFFTRCDTERLRPSCHTLLAPAFLELGKSRVRTGETAAAAEAWRTCTERFAGQSAARECDKNLRALEGG